MKANRRALLVEDDPNLGFLMREFLTSKGFDVVLCKDGTEGLARCSNEEFNIAILDVMLPGMDGFTLAQRIKEYNGRLPIIFVTARTMKEDKLKGFRMGVDDYITKPFDEDELYYRIQAILNRFESHDPVRQESVEIGKLVYDNKNMCIWHGKNCTRLTGRENEVFQYLVEHMGNLVRREELLSKIWKSNDYFAGRSLDVYISKLRKYLKDDPDLAIDNIPKVGFVLRMNEL
ncbi:MAG: response regulator transcription factor [Marinilabiliales bacterium]|nr:response regulator transcription factor [Marinilabiliales bacterium]